MMTLENLTTYDMRSMAVENFATQGSYTYYHTVIDNLKDVSREFACLGYVTVSYADGSTQTLYATVTDNVRSIVQIAEMAFADVATVQSGEYSNAVTGGYSSLTAAQRNTLVDIIRSTETIGG